MTHKTTPKEFIDQATAQPKRESPSGFHFISKYNENKREFWLHYVLGIRPVYTAPPLIFGGVIHDAIHYFYLADYDLDGALEVFRTLHEHRKEEYESPAVWENDHLRGPKMLSFWANRWGEHDRDTYAILQLEEQEEAELANGFKMTVRMDRVFKDILTDKVTIMDTKTTSWSEEGTFESFRAGDQATAYIWAARRNHPEWDIEGAVPDVIYQRKSTIRAPRIGIVTRTEQELREFEMEMIGLLMEMAQKVKSLGDWPAPYLFPRNGKDDSMFRGSVYDPLIRSGWNPTKPLPEGFVYDEELKEAQRAFVDKWEAATEE